VKQGDVIGNTGSGSRPQLHFGLRKGKAAVDPLSKLPPL
jgi:murein DD-endopeptidase MepM/ murein hydrolase activator NlpD